MSPENERRALEAMTEIRDALRAIVQLMTPHIDARSDLSELRGQFIRLDAITEFMSERVKKAEHDIEDTGSIYVDEMKKKLTTAEGSSTHWGRYVIATVVQLAIMIFVAYLGWALKGH